MTQLGSITTHGISANAALVQSIAGAGGSGGQTSFFSAAGAGAAGGDAGTVSVTTGNALMIANGASSSALIAQSIGGGGGVGGNAISVAVGAQVSIGGNGGLGGDGNAVTVDLGGDTILGSLDVHGDGGVLAQSIGGAGGAGGSAKVTGSAVFALAIGGDGGQGGAAGEVQLNSAALIATYGDHAAGILAQSIGGGGGKGGMAFTFNEGVVPAASVSVGGKGGIGGVAGTAAIVNSGGVTTFGSDANGVKVQSIGGGGGSGGAAVARAVSLATNENVPAISIGVAVGGSRGSGNRGGTASLTNYGVVTTAGEGSHALLAQSVGGGGGTGGDSTAAAFSEGTGDTVAVAISVAMGGKGGKGGDGGAARVSNDNLLLTLGTDAYGMVAQSVGGGGGIGGGGDASSSSGAAKFSFGSAIAVGGGGGAGGIGGIVRADNVGGIITGGDGSDAIFVQSVGGGGGAGGGGVGAAAGGKLSVSVGIGGDGGAGGDGGSVTALNGGGVVTRGVDAVGIYAQSVGGGGGKGGKGGATSGGVNPVNQANALSNALSGGFDLGFDVSQPIKGIFKFASIANEILKTAEQIGKLIEQLEGGPFDIGTAKGIDIGVAIGGKGGAAGNGSDVGVSNTGQISTFGAQSDAVFAQSVGGGGGKGGAATSTAKSATDARAQSAVGVGGSGGAGGDGGAVTVTNAKGAILETAGVLGFGIHAQSVGGGGGSGGMAGTVAGSFRSLSVGVGGSNGAQGDGGSVLVQNDGTIKTGAKHGIGILAQSIGGGGGLVRTMTTDQTFDPSDLVDNPQGRIGDLHGLGLQFGGGGGNSGGDAGAVQVNVSGSIVTAGRTAHGIVAQSIGGGGGAVIGGQLLGSSNSPTGSLTGNGGTVGVALSAGAVLTTAGDGAFGILAQSIGGGGGLAGDLANSVDSYSSTGENIIGQGTGSASDVTVALTGATVTTTGKSAPAIFAQSVGGGGGLLGIDNASMFVWAEGPGVGGDVVSVKLVGTTVSATGVQSNGILAQNSGSGGSGLMISIDAASSVTGGLASTGTFNILAGAISLIDGHDKAQDGKTNTINNAGRIAGIDGKYAAVALSNNSGDTIVNNSGTIIGSVLKSEFGSVVVNNDVSGVFDARARIELGSGGVFSNLGILQIGGRGHSATTTLQGDLVQGADGRLMFAADFAGGVSDLLAISGSADISGSIVVQPTNITNRPVTILTAEQGVTLAANLAPAPRLGVFALPVTIAGNTLQIRPVAHFSEAAAGLGRNQARIADNLQVLFDSGVQFDKAFGALGAIDDAPGFARALTSLSAAPLGSIAAFRFTTSQGFIANMQSGCSLSRAEPGNCAWARVTGGRTVQDGTTHTVGYSVRFASMQIGQQFSIAEDWSVSGSIAYENSRFLGDDAPFRANGDNLLSGLQLTYTGKPWQISAAVDGGYGWYSGRRVITVADVNETATSQPRAWHIGAHGKLAYELPIGKTAFVKPFADIHLVHVHSGSYVEQGSSPFSLAVLSQNQLAWGGEAGVEAGAQLAIVGDYVVRPFASAALAFLSSDWIAEARYAALASSAPTFRAETRTPGTLGRFTLGADLLGKKVDLRIQFMPDFASHYVTHAGMARFSYLF